MVWYFEECQWLNIRSDMLLCFSCFRYMFQVFWYGCCKSRVAYVALHTTLQVSVPNISSVFSDICCKCVYLGIAYVSHMLQSSQHPTRWRNNTSTRRPPSKPCPRWTLHQTLHQARARPYTETTLQSPDAHGGAILASRPSSVTASQRLRRRKVRPLCSPMTVPSSSLERLTHCVWRLSCLPATASDPICSTVSL
jgi:hypothetical protein